MSNEEREREAKEITSFYQGAKVLLPIAMSLMVTVVGWGLVAYSAAKESGRLEQRLSQAEKDIIEMKADVKVNRQELNGVKLNMAELKVDVKNIKEDTEETLQLVRNWTNRDDGR